MNEKYGLRSLVLLLKYRYFAKTWCMVEKSLWSIPLDFHWEIFSGIKSRWMVLSESSILKVHHVLLRREL